MDRAVDIARAREEESSFFADVYRWMAGGLFLSAMSAFFLIANPPLLGAVFSNPLLMIVLFLAPFGLILWLQGSIQTLPYGRAVGIYCAFSVVMGLGLTPVVLFYTTASLVTTFAVTAGTFIFFSVYGYTTKRDLTSVGGLLLMLLFGIIIASLVNIFLRSPMVYWITTYVGIAIFVGLTAYETQRLKQLYYSGLSRGDMRGKLAISGALSLYLSFINLFLLLLRIFGRRR